MQNVYSVKPKMKLLCSYVHGYVVKAIIIPNKMICSFPTSLTANELISERIDALILFKAHFWASI